MAKIYKHGYKPAPHKIPHVTIDEAKGEMTIRIKLKTPHVSKGGKNIVIASTGGSQPARGDHFQGRLIILSFNAWVWRYRRK